MRENVSSIALPGEWKPPPRPYSYGRPRRGSTPNDGITNQQEGGGDPDRVLGEGDDEIRETGCSNGAPSRFVTAERARDRPERPDDRADGEAVPGRRRQRRGREAAEDDARDEGPWPGAGRRPRELVVHELGTRAERQDHERNRPPEEGERRPLEGDPAELHRPGDHRDREERAQPRHEAEPEPGHEEPGGAHEALLGESRRSIHMLEPGRSRAGS